MFLYSDSVFIDAFEFEKKLCNIGSKMSFNILALFFKKTSSFNHADHSFTI